MTFGSSRGNTRHHHVESELKFFVVAILIGLHAIDAFQSSKVVGNFIAAPRPQYPVQGHRHPPVFQASSQGSKDSKTFGGLRLLEWTNQAIPQGLLIKSARTSWNLLWKVSSTFARQVAMTPCSMLIV